MNVIGALIITVYVVFMIVWAWFCWSVIGPREAFVP